MCGRGRSSADDKEPGSWNEGARFRGTSQQAVDMSFRSENILRLFNETLPVARCTLDTGQLLWVRAVAEEPALVARFQSSRVCFMAFRLAGQNIM